MVQFIKKENEIVVAGGWGRAEPESECLAGMKFQLGWWASSGGGQWWELHKT